MAAVKEKIKKSIAYEKGVFKPAIPHSHEGVFNIFAIASKIVLMDNSRIEEITRILATCVKDLVIPERLTAKECAGLWMIFIKSVEEGVFTNLEQGYPQYWNHLNELAAKIGVIPLAPWEEIPEGIEENNYVTALEDTTRLTGKEFKSIKGVIVSYFKAEKELIPEEIVLNELRCMSTKDLERYLFKWQRESVLRKSEVKILDRFAKSKLELGEKNQVLEECLRKIAYWVLEQEGYLLQQQTG